LIQGLPRLGNRHESGNQLSTLVIVANVFWDAAAIYRRGNGDMV
jgi:hypothetical protein